MTDAYDDRVARRWAATAVAPSLLLQAPPHLAALTSRRFKGLGWVPHFPFPRFSFLFSPFGSQTLTIRTFKSYCVYGGNEQVTAYAQGNSQAYSKTLEDLRKPQADPWHKK